jgi:DNA-binding GntR family transcriptional regulator
MMEKKEGQASERIVAEIKRRILDWVYPPEHPLVEESLSREFGVSRSPVREALRMLEADGFVRRIPNRGYYVKQVRLQEVADLYEVRLALELFALEKLAAKTDLHPEVRKLAGEWRASFPGPDYDAVSLAVMSQKFHEDMVELAGNATLLEALRRVDERLFAFKVMGFEQTLEQGSLETSTRNHLALAQAVVSGDPSVIREALETSIAHGRSNVEQAMGKALTRAYSGQAAPVAAAR